MRRSGFVFSLEVILFALWLGGGLFLGLVAAPAAFRMAPTRTIAADVVGAMLNWWHYLSIVVPLVFLVLELRRRGHGRGWAVVVLALALFCSSLQIGLDLSIRRMRHDSLISISDLPKTDPVRRRFGMLHGMSSLLLILQLVAAAGFTPALRDERDEPPEAPAA